jgi:hypothetical protein
VREDGTPAELEDLVTCDASTAIEIDGVSCRIAGYEGPDGLDPPWSVASASGSITIELTYHLRRREVVERRNHRSITRHEYDCPFARTRRRRERGERT